MNPFDLPGPSFLTFYAALSFCVIVLFTLFRRWLEQGPVPKLTDLDPYQVAFLRDGEREAIRVAVMTLCCRELLTISGDTVTTRPDALERVRRPFERHILEACRLGEHARHIPSLSTVQRSAEGLESQLISQGLLPNESQHGVRILLVVVAALGLAGTALRKIILALERGHSNIILLVVFAVVAVFAARYAIHPFRTPVGDKVVSGLKSLFEGLRERTFDIQFDAATNEFTWLIAVHGVTALSGNTLVAARGLFPEIMPRRAGSDSSSSGGCGSSCGGGCGSGGCGGGCGGCGG
jgi:uncharacterized protein (TIGR04222 family)